MSSIPTLPLITSIEIKTSTILKAQVGTTSEYLVMRFCTVVVNCGNGVKLFLEEDNLPSIQALSNFALGFCARYTITNKDDQDQLSSTLLFIANGVKQVRFSCKSSEVTLELNQHNLSYLAQLARLRDWCSVTRVSYPNIPSEKFCGCLPDTGTDSFKYNSVDSLKVSMIDGKIFDHREVPKKVAIAKAVPSKAPASSTVVQTIGPDICPNDPSKITPITHAEYLSRLADIQAGITAEYNRT